MAYCTKCGKQNNDLAKFCTSCGTAIKNNVSQSEKQPENSSRKTPGKKILLLSIIFLIGLSVACYFIFFNKQNNSSANKETSNKSALAGLYPFTSERLLLESELENMSKESLRIMRNEIYARHGLIFQNSDMNAYFSSQVWYTPKYSSVTYLLTTIEKNNIAMIKKYEDFQEEFGNDYNR